MSNKRVLLPGKSIDDVLESKLKKKKLEVEEVDVESESGSDSEFEEFSMEDVMFVVACEDNTLDGGFDSSSVPLEAIQCRGPPRTWVITRKLCPGISRFWDDLSDPANIPHILVPFTEPRPNECDTRVTENFGSRLRSNIGATLFKFISENPPMDVCDMVDGPVEVVGVVCADRSPFQ